MNVRKIIGIVLVIVGALFLYGSNYINTQVAEGRMQISSAQKKVDTTGTLFSLHPATKQVGKQFTNYAQNKIDEGSQEANQYAQYANWCMIGGIALIVIGIGVFFTGRKKAQ
jgi:hypothetical protein